MAGRLISMSLARKAAAAVLLVVSGPQADALVLSPPAAVAKDSAVALAGRAYYTYHIGVGTCDQICQTAGLTCSMLPWYNVTAAQAQCAQWDAVCTASAGCSLYWTTKDDPRCANSLEKLCDGWDDFNRGASPCNIESAGKQGNWLWWFSNFQSTQHGSADPSAGYLKCDALPYFSSSPQMCACEGAAPPTTTTPAPPAPPSTFGDPHAANMKGEKFDILAPGNHTYLVVPRGAEQESALLHVQAVIEPAGPVCAGQLYVTGLVYTGKWLGETRRLAFFTRMEGEMDAKEIKFEAGESNAHLTVSEFKSSVPTTLAEVTELQPEVPKSLNQHVTTVLVKLKMGPAISKVRMVYQKEKFRFSNSLWFTTTGLNSTAGGILGLDSHESAAAIPTECQSKDQDGIMRSMYRHPHSTVHAVVSSDADEEEEEEK